MSGLLVIAPHPDDETLGAGGTLLAAAARGIPIHWAIMTASTAESGSAPRKSAPRQLLIEAVTQAYSFASVHDLSLPASQLDTIPRAEIVSRLSRIVNDCAADSILLPHPDDAHSDHAVTFACGLAATKGFRHPSVRRVWTMEIVSETNFGRPGTFVPRHYVDVSAVFERKLDIMRQYEAELGEHPFPRSIDALRALAVLRGSECGVERAEAFDVIRSRGDVVE